MRRLYTGTCEAAQPGDLGAGKRTGYQPKNTCSGLLGSSRGVTPFVCPDETHTEWSRVGLVGEYWSDDTQVTGSILALYIASWIKTRMHTV